MGKDYVIKGLTGADEPLLWDMLYQGLHGAHGSDIPSPNVVHQPELARYVENWGRPGDAGFVAHDPETGKPLGAVWFRNPASSDPGAASELAFAVNPAHRRRGIGAALLTQLVKANPQQSAVSIRAPASNPAVRLYERFGFKVVETRPDSVTMRREM